MINFENPVLKDTELAVTVDITAPLYWWKEFDFHYFPAVLEYSLSDINVQEKVFTLDDFSHEHLLNMANNDAGEALFLKDANNIRVDGDNLLDLMINVLNYYRERYLRTMDKRYWWQMIQLLPSSYNYSRRIEFTYDILADIYKRYRNHEIDEWCEFCKWIETLPNSEFIMISTGLDYDSIHARLGLPHVE